MYTAPFSIIPQLRVSAAQSFDALAITDEAMRVPRRDTTVSWSAVSLFVATSPSNREGSFTATPVAVVVQGALRRAANEARVVSTFAPINTFPAVVPIAATKVNTCPLIETVSPAVG